MSDLSIYLSCLFVCSLVRWFAFLWDAGHLREVFRKIDADNNGSICVDELKMVLKSEGKTREQHHLKQ